jgi:hypothetical protein
MQTTQGNMLQSLRNVAAFLDEHAAALPGVVQSGARQRLTDAIAELTTHAADQTGSKFGVQGASQKQKALRRALLRDHMTPVARIAAADLPHTPELAPLRLPKGSPTSQKLAAAAFGMAEAAAPFASVFTAAGLPADFTAQLTAAADAMIAAISDGATNRNTGRGATTGLKAKLSTGRKVVRVLDAFVQSALKEDAALRSSWNGAKRVQRVGSGRPAKVTVPTPAPTAAPTAGTASALVTPTVAPVTAAPGSPAV